MIPHLLQTTHRKSLIVQSKAVSMPWRPVLQGPPARAVVRSRQGHRHYDNGLHFLVDHRGTPYVAEAHETLRSKVGFPVLTAAHAVMHQSVVRRTGGTLTPLDYLT